MKRHRQLGVTTIELVIAGVVIVILLAVIFSLRPQRVIGVSATTISVPAGGQTTFTATLLAKGWGWGAPAPVAGTISHRSGSIVQITPISAPTSAAAPNLTLTVNGAVAGNGTITVTGKSGGDTHSVAEVKVTVTSG